MLLHHIVVKTTTISGEIAHILRLDGKCTSNPLDLREILIKHEINVTKSH